MYVELAVVGIWFAMSFNCFGQNVQKPLNLDECLQAARSAPSAVTRARLQTLSARRGVRAAQANFLPQLTLANSFTYNSPLLYAPGQFSFVALNGVHEYTSAIGTSLEVDTAGRLRAQLDRARADREIADASLTISDRDLVRSVTMAYYRVLLARKLAESAKENLNAARDFEDRVRHLEAGGEASRADLTKASLEVALLERTAQASTLEADLAAHDLASYWTTDVTAPVQLMNDLDQPLAAPPAANTDSPFLRRPEFKVLAGEETGFRADARQARSRMLPQLNLSFQYGIDSLHISTSDRGYAGFVHLDIPLFDWLRAHNEQKQFQFQAQQVATDVIIAKRIYSKEYQDALAMVSNSYAQTSTTEQQLALAKENLRLSLVRFEGGEGLALDVVTSQTALAQAEIDYYSARANYLNAQSALKVAGAE
jgi:outer membrane protein TolC